jgi:hypothetical protein
LGKEKALELRVAGKEKGRAWGKQLFLGLLALAGTALLLEKALGGLAAESAAKRFECSLQARALPQPAKRKTCFL